MPQIFQIPRAYAVDGNGKPYAGARAFFYVTGTSTPKTTYSDYALSVPNANPVVADSNGLFPSIFLATDTRYRVVLKTSVAAGDVTLYTQDDVGGAMSASSLTFTSSGTGAVTRTAQDKLRDMVSVKDFGALGDGSTDDIAAFTLALTYGASVGIPVYVPPGKYMVSTPIRVPENTGLVGASFIGGAYSGAVQGSSIWAMTTFNYPTRGIIESYNVSGGGLQEFAPVTNISVFGNMTNGAICGAGIMWKAVFVNSVIRDVQIQECSGDGIMLDGTGGGGPVEIQNVWINNCNGNSLNIDGPFQYVRVRDVAFERWGKTATSGTKYAIRAVNSTGGDTLRYLLVDGFYSELQSGKNHDCIYLSNASYVVLRNVSAGGGSNTETGAFIRITQTGGSASYAYPRGSNVLGVICEQVYVGTSATSYSAGTIIDSVNGVTRKDYWIPRYSTAEVMITIGSSGAPAFANSWVDRGGGFQPAGYIIDGEGYVCLFGGVKNGTVNSAAFTLPAGARPAYGVQFAVPSNALFGMVQINSSGDVIPITPSSNVYVSLEGIRFKALA